MYQTLDESDLGLLREVLNSDDYRARAAAVRVTSEWKEHINDDALYHESLSEVTAKDPHHRVRLEAVRALAGLNNAEAFDSAMLAYDDDMNKFLEYALWTTARELKDEWLPEAEAGDLTFTKNVDAYVYALNAVDAKETFAHFMKLFDRNDLTLAQRKQVLKGIGKYARWNELGPVTEGIYAIDGSTEAEQIELLNALVSATRNRNINGRGGFTTTMERAEDGSDAMRVAALKAIAAWKLSVYRPNVEAIVREKKTPASVLRAAIGALAEIGDANSVTMIASMATDSNDMATRLSAIEALMQLSVEDASREAVELFSSNDAPDPSSLVRAFLKAEGGSAALAAALRGATLAPENAKRAELVVSASGRDENMLLSAVRAAGGLDEGAPELTKKQMEALVEKVQTRGDAKRGRKHFRNLDCYQCHALAGAGGTLGPEMTSIGASAQIDYLIESNYYPDKAIKEGYHSLLIDKKDGDFVSGIKVTETNSELILRNALTNEIRIPLSDIASREDGGSLMPTGLGDSLLEDEFVDLVRFLSELGRTPEFSAGTGRHVRTWQVLEDSEPARDYLYEAQPEAAAQNHETLVWVPEYSYITGEIAMSEVPRLKHRYWTTAYSFLRFGMNAPGSGTVALKVTPVEGVQLYRGEQEVAIASDGTALLDVSSGETQCTVLVNRDIVRSNIDIQLLDNASTTVAASFTN